MTNVCCDLKRKEDELRKCVMNGALSLRVSNTGSNCGSSKTPFPTMFLYWAVLIINSKKKSCSYLFYWKDSTQISYNMLVADGALEPLLGASKEQQNLHVWIHLSSPAKEMLCIPQFHFSISSGGKHKTFGSWLFPTKATPKGTAETGYARGMWLWVKRGRVQKRDV